MRALAATYLVLTSKQAAGAGAKLYNPSTLNTGLIFWQPQCTLLVLIDFCPVESEFLTWSFAY